jgi:hypothetical protein
MMWRTTSGNRSLPRGSPSSRQILAGRAVHR